MIQPLGVQLTPHLPMHRQLTFRIRQHANERWPAPVACLLVLVSASLAACCPQLDSARFEGYAHEHRHGSSDFTAQQPDPASAWGGQAS